MQQEQKLWQLEAQVEAVTVQNGDVQTAIDQVNAITW
jgi:hypothetical protein